MKLLSIQTSSLAASASPPPSSPRRRHLSFVSAPRSMPSAPPASSPSSSSRTKCSCFKRCTLFLVGIGFLNLATKCSCHACISRSKSRPRDREKKEFSIHTIKKVV
uniref:Uncharacterized protein n=2 Tax=Physcomitrium patens TaxID=3218 RepID=A0A7I4ERB4_PHYPA